jgi:hypothetical protein
MPEIQTTPVNAPESPANWISTSEAAARLGVSERTVLRRAKTGVLLSRKETTARGVMMLVSLEGADVPTGADTGPNQSGQGQTPDVATGGAKVPTEVPTGADTDFKAHLIAENAFLRGVIEQLQRDGAETRNALRKALELAPKMLTPGESSTIVSDVKSDVKDAKSDAKIEESGPKNHATGKVVNGPQNGVLSELDEALRAFVEASG